MIINNKYYFLSTDIFHWLRIYVFTTLILIAAFILVSLNISFAPIITTLLLTIRITIDLGYIAVINSTEIHIKKNYSSKILLDISPYKYWWNYDFNTGSKEEEKFENTGWKTRSNKVIVNLLLQNGDYKIHFKETIRLDTRHPNDAIYLEEFDNSTQHVIHIQRIDKLILYLKKYYKASFTLDENYIKMS